MTTGDTPINWELGDEPGDCVVTLGPGRVLLVIRVGGPDNSVVMGVERATLVASALLEAAGLAGWSTQVPHGGDLLSAKADLASARAVLREAAKQGAMVRLGPEVVRALVTVLDGEAAENPKAMSPGEVSEEELERGRQATGLLQDLDRCEHGRHSTDSCLDCPGGKSSGNRELPPGTLAGHSYTGSPIVVPDQDDRSDPQNWRV